MLLLLPHHRQQQGRDNCLVLFGRFLGGSWWWWDCLVPVVLKAATLDRFWTKTSAFPLTMIDRFWRVHGLRCNDKDWWQMILGASLLRVGIVKFAVDINQVKSKLVIDTSTADQQCWARPAQDRTQIRPHILVPSLPAFLRPTHTREIVPAASPLIEFRDWIVNLENWKPSFWLFSPGHRPGGIRCSGSSTLVLTSWHQSGFESPSPPNIRTSGHQPRFLIALVTAALPPLPLGRAADMKI